MNRPNDYIDIRFMQKVKKKTLRDLVLHTCRRFYDQPFTCRDVYNYLAQTQTDNGALYVNVRSACSHFARKGELKTLVKGKSNRSGGGVKPAVFGNPEFHKEKTQ